MDHPWRLAKPDGSFVRDADNDVIRFGSAPDALRFLKKNNIPLYKPWEDAK